MKDLNIREFQHSDSEAYAHTLLLTLPCDDLDEARENVNILMERLEKETRELWVAESENIQVGFMLLEFQIQEHNIEIDWFDIHPDYQQRGVGEALVLKADERARTLRYQTITLHTAASNQSMRNFAERYGFREEACLPKFWGEDTEDAYLFMKKLD